MVSRSVQIILLIIFLSGCAATQKEILTITEYVEVPIIKYKKPNVPDFFGKEFKPSNVVFVENNGMVCLADDNSKKLRHDIEILSGRIKAQNNWFNSMKNNFSED